MNIAGKRLHCKGFIEIAVIDATDIEAEQSVSLSASSLEKGSFRFLFLVLN